MGILTEDLRKAIQQSLAESTDSAHHNLPVNSPHHDHLEKSGLTRHRTYLDTKTGSVHHEYRNGHKILNHTISKSGEHSYTVHDHGSDHNKRGTYKHATLHTAVKHATEN